MFSIRPHTLLICAIGLSFLGCQTPEQKAENAQNNLQDAKHNLALTQQKANQADQKVADANEWKTFRTESEAKIKNNSVLIESYKYKMKHSGKIMDSVYEYKIHELDKENKKLISQMDEYEKQNSDWETFKKEFNRDMEKVGKSIKDLMDDTKK